MRLPPKKKRWALVIYPNFEYGQSASSWFKEMLKKAQPDVEFVTEQATPLGKIDAGAVVQAIDDAKPDAIFNVLFAADLAKLVREGTTRGSFNNRTVVSLLSGEPEYLDPLKDEAPVGWIVTGYPWDEIDTPAHKAFLSAYQKRWNDYPRLGSVVGYDTMKSLAAGIAKAGTTDTDKLIAAFRGLKLTNPFGSFEFRAIDHQATMGAYVGRIAREERQRHHDELQICRRRKRAAERRRGEETAPGSSNELKLERAAKASVADGAMTRRSVLPSPLWGGVGGGGRNWWTRCVQNNDPPPQPSPTASRARPTCALIVRNPSRLGFRGGGSRPSLRPLLTPPQRSSHLRRAR